jgi:hypothetical protein
MSTVPQVLAEVKNRRQLEAHRETLTNPWYRIFFPTLSLLPLLLLLGIELAMPQWLGVRDASLPTFSRWLVLAAVITWSMVSTLLLLHKRERAWLALIKNECPQLYRELRQPPGTPLA